MFVPFAEATKKRAFRGIGTCRKRGCENKHGQTVLRKQDEWLFSSVIKKHSGEYNALVDQIVQSTEFPQTRAERFGEINRCML